MSGEIRITTKRNTGLDLLRIGLAILIFMFHSNMHLNCQYGVLTHFAQMGAIAMTGFFMMSGYALNLSNKEVLTDVVNYKKFLYKRLVSIFPLYYFVALVYIVLLGKESWQSVLLLLPFEVLGLQSCFSSLFSISHNGGTWFISCIVLCYILFPFLQWLFKRLCLKEQLATGGGIFLLLLIAPIVQRQFHLASIYDNPFFRMLEFSLGLIVALWCDRLQAVSVPRALSNKALLLFVIIVMVVGVSVGDVLLNENVRDFMLMNCVVLPCFIVIFLMLGSVIFDQLSNSRVIQYASKLSYAFFLAQFFVFPLSYHIIAYWLRVDNNCIRVTVSFMVCLGLSVFLHECVEKPAATLLRKL